MVRSVLRGGRRGFDSWLWPEWAALGKSLNLSTIQFTHFQVSMRYCVDRNCTVPGTEDAGAMV